MRQASPRVRVILSYLQCFSDMFMCSVEISSLYFKLGELKVGDDGGASEEELVG
jgi:hypothetical protein